MVSLLLLPIILDAGGDNNRKTGFIVPIKNPKFYQNIKKF